MNIILFDLDGTLLPLDFEQFEKEYFKGLCLKLSNYFTPDMAVKYIWEATAEMVKSNDPETTNQEVFMKKFSEISKTSSDEMYDLFLNFYKNEFRDLGKDIKPSQYILDSIKALKEKGYRLVIATNPLFPIEAIHERIGWAGLDVEEFIYITSFEKMHFCKPNIKYYEEILHVIGAEPEECLMVGNDVEEDLIAGQLGIKTFLIENHILNKKNIEPMPDFKGNYNDFFNFASALPRAAFEEDVKKYGSF
jgi:FMN phosphatase YigB (HAD superfamily)